MSGIVGSRLNIRGSGIIGSLGTDGQILTSAGAGDEIVFETRAGDSNIVTTGALDSGSITSGFGAIDNGTSGIRTDTFTAETSLVPDASGGADLGTASLEWGDFYIADDKYINFGSDQNVLVGYDETTTDSLKIAATEGAGLAITLMADEGDDAGDEWKLNVADGGVITLGNDIASAGTYVTHLTLTPNSTVTSSVATFAGEVDAVTLDISGDADIDGTLEADAITIGGTAIGSIYGVVAGSSSIVTTGALDTGSITSGFGTIDTGASAITTTGLISGGSLDIDNVLINGTTIGHTDDTDLITVADGLVTVAGEVQMTTLDIGGTNVSATAAELNYSDLATLGTTAASKVFSADANNLTAISGGVVLTEDTLSFDATQDWDVRASPVAKVTLTANVTFDAPTNPTTGQYIAIVCIQDGTGSRTIAWNAIFEFTGDAAPTATTTAAKGDMFTFRYNGSKWLEVGRNLNLTLS